MNARFPHRLVTIVLLLALLVASGGLAIVRAAPGEGSDQRVPTEEGERDPVFVGTLPPVLEVPPTPVPTRPPRITPTPAGVPTQTPTPRVRPTPTSEPRVTATASPVDPRPTLAVQPTSPLIDPMPNPPQPGDSIPITIPPYWNQPLVPGEHNRFEITLYSCPAATDPASDEASLLAACGLHVDSAPNDVAFQMRDGDQTHVRHDGQDGADDSTYVFDDITVIPGPRFFILEEFDAEFNAGWTDPVVFCSENGGPSQPVPAPLRVIRPNLSTFSNVEYTCNWFKLPLTGDSVHLFSRHCLTSPNASQLASFSWFWINCSTPWQQEYQLTDVAGPRTEPDAHAVHWTNVGFGTQDSVEIARLNPAAVNGHAERAFCGTFNDGTLRAMADGAITLDGDGGASASEHVCWWYLYPVAASFDQGIQIPNSLDVQATLCPADLPVDVDPLAYITSCQASGTAAVDVDMTFVYPDSVLIGTLPTTDGGDFGETSFGLIGNGQGTLVPGIPDGYVSYRYTCASSAYAYTHQGAFPATITVHFGWGSTMLCQVVFIPEGAPAASTAQIPAQVVVRSSLSQPWRSGGAPDRD